MTEEIETLREKKTTSAPSAAVPAFVLKKKSARLATIRETLDPVLVNPSPVLVEFGCGHGHWLTDYAAAHPGELCLGLDLISARVRKANAKRARHELAHLLFLKAEANEFLSVWPEDRLIHSVFMLFPDPWPKKRHHKNRMIQTAFLDRLVAITPLGARFHFRTDDRDYFEWATEHFAAHPGWAIDATLPWPWERPTIFQMKMEDWSSLIAVRV